jgi:hypothetical protein
VLSHENRLKNALFTANNVILRFLFAQDQKFSKIHKTDKNFFLAKSKNTCLMILNDKPNWQISMILMSPFPILSDSSENYPNLERGQLIPSTLKLKELEFEKTFLNFRVKHIIVVLCRPVLWMTFSTPNNEVKCNLQKKKFIYLQVKIKSWKCNCQSGYCKIENHWWQNKAKNKKKSSFNLVKSIFHFHCL